MPRPNRSDEQRQALLPVIAKAFAALGYRRATTAELAKRCGVQENILYRLWPSKKAMFVAAIEHIYDRSTGFWDTVLADPGDGSTAAERLLRFEAEYQGERGISRIVFTGLAESDDPEIRAALRRMYGRYLDFIARRLREHRALRAANGAAPDETSAAEIDAWAVIGLGTIAEIGGQLGLLADSDRRRLWTEAGDMLLHGRDG